MKRYESEQKPSKCPVCGSTKVASVLYGMPAWSEELESDHAAGRVTLGGCTISSDDPPWACADCGEPIYKKTTESESGHDLPPGSDDD